MADELKDQRVVTMMSPTELEAIDDWMFKSRIRSRGEAIRRLCQVGIRAQGEFSDLSNDVSNLYKEVRKSDSLIPDHPEKLPTTLKGLQEYVIQTITMLMPIRVKTANVVIKVLQLEGEMLQFRRPGEIEELIAEAHALREKAREYWEADSSDDSSRIPEPE